MSSEDAYKPEIFDFFVGFISYGEETEYQKPKFIKMWPKKAQLEDLDIDIKPKKKRFYIKFKQEKPRSVLVKFSETIGAHLFRDQGKEYLAIQLKRPPRVSELAQYFGTKPDFYRRKSFFQLKNQYLNSYLLKPVLVLEVGFGSPGQRQIFKEQTLQKLRYPDERKPFDWDGDFERLYEKAQQFDIMLERCQKSYELCFLIQCLISSGISNPADFNLIGFFSLLSEQKQKKLFLECLYELCDSKPLSPGIMVTMKLKKLLKKKKQNYKEKKLRKQFQKIFRISITPSLIYYFPPMHEMGNHVTRLFSKELNRFLRVTFMDQNHKSVFYYSDKERPLANYIKEILLQKDLNICFRSYKFLATSSSQMKRHSIWMINEKDDFKFKKIFELLGDFDQEKYSNKNLSRRGQCFSTTLPVCRISPDAIQQEQDIITKYTVQKDGKIIHKQSTFSDGIGRISSNLAKKCALAYGYRFMSAFQIRCGGAKGVLTLDTKLSPKESKVVFRTSMLKFKGYNPQLQIIRCATFSQGLLNRQCILLLSTLGVPNNIFLDMLKQEIQDLNHLAFNYQLTENNETLFNNLPFFHDQIREMMNNKEVKDPLFSSILSSFSFNRLMMLKGKCKIMDKHSARLIGVLDEYGVLEQDEVFCQFCRSNFELNKTISGVLRQDVIKTLEGDVIVSKNPCISTGDIRKLKAVKYPQLKHLVNVIVFSQKGKVPQFKKMAGGDLDGDVYYITANQAIVQNLPGMDPPAQFYSKGKPKPLEQVTEDDLIESFTNYIQQDNLGIIANRYLAIADSSELMARDPRCEELGGMHAQAVDFAKHGKCVPRSQLMKQQFRVQTWPHFFEKKYEEMHRSVSILGKLYDYIKLHGDYIIENTEKNRIKGGVFEKYMMDTRYIIKGFEKHLEAADQLYEDYVKKIKRILFEYGLDSEAQLFSFDLSSLDKRTFNKDKYDSENELRLRIHDLQKEMQDCFEDKVQEFEPEDDIFDDNFEQAKVDDKLKQMRLELASAVYFVTYFSDGAINKEDVLDFLTSLFDGHNQKVDAFLHKKKEEYQKKQRLLEAYEQELGEEGAKLEEERKEKVKEKGKGRVEMEYSKFRKFLAYSRKLREHSQVWELSKVLSFPWVCCAGYMKKIRGD